MKMAERKERSRRALMDAVLELIHEGTANPSITEVCRRADVTRPTFYQHFASVDDLVSRAVAGHLSSHQEAALRLDADASTDDLERAITDLLDRVWEDRVLIAAVRAHGGTLSSRAAIDTFSDRILERTPPPHDDALILRARFAAAGVTELFGAWLRVEDPDAVRDTIAPLLHELVRDVMRPATA